MYEDVVSRLKDGEVLVDEGLLKPGGRSMVRGKIQVIRDQTGRTARVWVRPLGEGVDGLDEVFAAAGLDEADDLLVVFDGRVWTARGWSLRPASIRAALADGERGLERNWAHGVVAALIALDLAAHEARADRPAPLPGVLGGLGLGAVLVGGAIGWTWYRQRQLSAQGEAGSGADGS